MAIVYRHRDNLNNVFYVGIGKNEDRAFDYLRRSEFWKRYSKKYGVSTEIIAKDIDYDTAKELEMLLISEYGRRDLGLGNLVNMTDGGDGSVGRKQSKEEIQKRVNSLKGKKRSQETKNKMSEVRKGIVFSEQHIKNLSISHKGIISSNAKKVKNIDTGKLYLSLRNACLSENLNYKTEHIRMSKNPMSKKNKFKYI